MWNIGIEGQIIMGAVGSTLVARSIFGDDFISPYLQIFMAIIFGAFWGLISAILKVKANVHEIFSGLGLDFVASGIVIFLIIGPWKREGIASTGGTDIFDKASWVPTIGNSNFPLFLLLVIFLLYLVSALVIKYSSLGIRLKATGINIFATERFYFTSDKYIIFSCYQSCNINCYRSGSNFINLCIKAYYISHHNWFMKPHFINSYWRHSFFGNLTSKNTSG